MSSRAWRIVAAVLLAGSGLSSSVPGRTQDERATQAAEPIVVGERWQVSSLALGQDREVLVRLPADYSRSRQHYPVLFVLDGNYHFVYTAGMLEFLARNARVPDMILVAVPTLQRRVLDLSPPFMPGVELTEKEQPFQAPQLSTGGAPQFLRFLADELAPWVDARYRTQPYRILSGHSLGGLFSFYALMERPDAFQAHVAVSPSLWWNQNVWVEQARQRLGALPGRHWLYFSWGDDESWIRDSSQALVDWMRKQDLPGLSWKSRYYAGDDHGTTPLRTLYDGLEWLYAGWRLDLHEPEKMTYADLQQRIREHHDGLSQRYGYRVDPGPQVRKQLSAWLFERERYDEALEEARANLDAHPEAKDLYRHISDILDKQGRAVEALAAYRQALPDTNEYESIWQIEHRLHELERKAAGLDANGATPSP